jgi:hypothetical protein
VTAAFVLSGCIAPHVASAPPLLPSPVPSQATELIQPIGSSPPDGPVYADVGFEVFGPDLVVEVQQAGGRPLEGAWVRLLGPSLAGGKTDSSGRLRLGPILPAVDYRVCVEAPDFVTTERGPIEIKPGADPVRLEAFELKQAARARGRVLNGGRPVVGAVVSDGMTHALTDANGRYEIRSLDSGVLTLTASKPRHRLATRSVTTEAGQWLETDLTLVGTAPQVYFDHRVAAGVEPSQLSILRGYLQGRGWQLLDAPPSQSGDAVWVMLVPGRDLSASEQEQVLNFVAQGGKFVLLGDWAGNKGFRTPAANALLHRLGLHISANLIRDFADAQRPSWLTVGRFRAEHPVTVGVTALRFFSSASVFGLYPMMSLAETGDRAFRVQSVPAQGIQVVVSGGAFKGGKAIVLGDVSAFLDEDSVAAGRANVDEVDNKRFFEQLLDW